MSIASQGRAPSRGVLARAAVPATVLCASVAATIAAGVAFAGPAAAMADPRRPAVEVTHGPSCGPAAVRVQVTGGNAAGHVALVLDGTAVQQEADLAPGQQVELGSADIDWGVTVDVSVTAAGADGQALEPTQLGTYTRPSREDCEAIAAPSTDVVPPSDGLPAVPPPTAASASSSTVAPGGVVRVRASGFAPGEQVTVTMAGRRAPLATVAAGQDGRVSAVVQIPHGAGPGSADVQLVGADSAATAGVALQVSARGEAVAAGEESTRPVALMAGAALLVAAGGLGASARRRPEHDGHPADLGR